MITFEPLGAEIRIVVPDAVGAVVRGRIRLLLSENSDGFTATAGEASWLGIAEKPEPVTIYDVIGLTSTVLEELADIILANSEATALYARLPDGTAGRFARAMDARQFS
jgi:hypothetical protein